jgi:hypothetical protein
MQTWLFQRFTRPDHPDLVPSTLEIRGTPPRLWIERQPSTLSVPTTGTVYEDFPCAGSLGPCMVDEPMTPPPIADAENRFCHGHSYPFPGTREWEPILGDHISTPIFGLARGSHLAGEDNILTHEHQYDEGCHIADCPSDWNVSVLPNGPQRNIAPETSIVAENTYVELEYGLLQPCPCVHGLAWSASVCRCRAVDHRLRPPAAPYRAASRVHVLQDEGRTIPGPSRHQGRCVGQWLVAG